MPTRLLMCVEIKIFVPLIAANRHLNAPDIGLNTANDLGCEPKSRHYRVR